MVAMEKTFWSPMKEGSKAISDCEQVKRLIRLAPAPQIVVVEEDLGAAEEVEDRAGDGVIDIPDRGASLIYLDGSPKRIRV
jgi:hypothetical protein